jgi:hypothetical protein
MPQFSLKHIFAITSLAAAELFFLTFLVGPRIRTYLWSSWGAVMICVWIVFGAYLGMLAFRRTSHVAAGMCAGATVHFVIAIYGLLNYQ